MQAFLQSYLGSDLAYLTWTLIKIAAIVVPLMGCVAYLTLAERKIIGFMQLRLGPNRTGWFGVLQPIADALKLLTKEIILPSAADRFLFLIAPILSIMPAIAAWAVIPFTDQLVLSNIDASLLYVMALTSFGIYGIMIAGWASNSKYALLGAMRAGAQIISYELGMGFALVGVLMVSGSLNLVDIVMQQKTGLLGIGAGSIFSWNWLPLFPLCLVYFISGLAESNRAPFDVAEGESEIVAGFHVEYSGMGFAIFFLAEYANMILIACLCTLMFFGGWLSPFPIGIPIFGQAGFFWLAFKVAFLLYCFLWIRATLPRFRYDQIMRLGWKIFIPVTLVWLVLIGLWIFADQLMTYIQ